MGMTKPSIKTITVKNLINFLLLAAVVLLIIIGLSFRAISYKIIKNKTIAISEVIIAGLTSHMKAGIMDRRDYFLEEIRSLYEIKEVSIIRSTELASQFGLGFQLEKEADDVAKKTFETGMPVFSMDEFNINPHVRALIPYIATEEGSINCLSCHQVQKGTVLGAVDIRLDLTAYRNLSLGVLTGITLLACVFIALISINTFKTVQQHIKEPLESLISRAKEAYYGHKPINPENYGSLEFEDIARKFNMFNTEILANQDLIKEKNLELTALNDEIEDTMKETVFTMGVVEEQRSKETRDHTRRVAEYCHHLASILELPVNDIELITAASPLHDIGKLGIPDSILLKEGALTDDEFEVMKNHPGIGYAMLVHSRRDILQAAAVIAYQHHEKWDGTGYPRGLKGEDIHIYGRIISLADVFDSLSFDRVYRNSWKNEDIIDFIRKERGKHFQPDLVDFFLRDIDIFFAIRERYSVGI
jgi:response regulator RpfG family c-di-GMP phosphodiesterase